MKKFKITIIVILILTLPQLLLAGEAKKEKKEAEVIQLAEIVVTAPGVSVADVATVSEVTAEEIELYGAENLKEALTLVPGASSVLYCPCKGEGEILLRGHNQKAVRILVDGIPIGSAARNGRTGFPLSEFPITNIEKIKVIKGIPSVLYGSNDYGGIINIITKQPVSEKPEFSFSLEGGTNRTERYAFNHGRNIGNLNYWVSTTHSESDGVRLSNDFDPKDYSIKKITGDEEAFDNDPSYENGGRQDNSDYDRNSFAIKLGCTPGAETNIGLLYMYNNSEQGIAIPPNPYLSMETYPWYWRWPDNETHHISLSGGKGGQIYGREFEVRGRVYYSLANEELICYTDPTYSTRKWEEHSDSYTIGTHVDADYELSRGHLVRFGIDYRVDAEDRKGISDGTVNPEKEFKVDTTSVAVEDEIHLTDSIICNIGASLNFFNVKDQPGGGSKSDFTEFNPQIGIAYNPQEDLGFHFACGRKVAFPRIKDMYPVGQWNPMFKSNFDLDPEDVFALEIGMKKDMGSIGKAQFTFFRDEIDDMIESGPKPGGGMWMENKPGKRIISGIELDLEINPLKSLFWGLDYCYLDTEEKDTHKEVLFRPKHSGNSYIRYVFNFGLTAQLDMDFSSKKRTKLVKKVVSPRPIFDYVKTGDYYFLNLRLRQKFKDGCAAYLNITNLLDADEKEGFCPRQRLKPLLGRMFTAGVSIRF